MFDPALAPFTIALIVMLLIAATEAVGMAFGASPSSALETALPDFDADANPLDADAPHAPDAPTGPLSQLMSWLCVGRVPLLVLLVAFLTAFGVAGVVLQSALKGVIGFYLPAVVMIVPAFLLALPATRAFGLGLSKIMPREETEAVSDESFIGRVATVIRGEAKRGLPAEAKLKDLRGQTHYVLVEPDGDDEVYSQGAEVLVVQKIGAVYRVIRNEHPSLRSGD